MALYRPVAELGKVTWEMSDKQSGTAQPRALGAPFKELHMNFARGIVATTIGILALLAISSISGCPPGSSPSDGAPDPGTEDTGGGTPDPGTEDTGGGGQTSDAEVIFDNGNIEGVFSNPTAAAEFTTQRTYRVTLIRNYHWNNGQGTPNPGTIALTSSSGTTYGPWQTTGSPGQGNVPNVNWTAAPDTLIPPGTYTVIDSDTATWAQNATTGNAGMTHVEGIPEDGTDEVDTGGIDQVQVNVSIEPSEVSRPEGSADTVLFQAVVTVATGLSNEVIWSITEAGGGGTITAFGVYDPSSAVVGDYHVVATSKADPTKSATALVHITGPKQLSFSGTYTHGVGGGGVSGGIPGMDCYHLYDYTISAAGTVVAYQLTEWQEELTAEYTGDGYGYLYLTNANRSQPITLNGTVDIVLDPATFDMLIWIYGDSLTPPATACETNGYLRYTVVNKRYTHILYAADGSVKSTEEKATGAFAFNLAKDENAKVQVQLDFTTQTYIYEAELAVLYGGPGTETTTYTVFTLK
jgi:hypothetical protein